MMRAALVKYYEAFEKEFPAEKYDVFDPLHEIMVVLLESCITASDGIQLRVAQSKAPQCGTGAGATLNGLHGAEQGGQSSPVGSRLGSGQVSRTQKREADDVSHQS